MLVKLNRRLEKPQ